MKKRIIIYVFLLLCFGTYSSQAQTATAAASVAIKDTIRGYENLKSGNTKDVMISFLQLAYNDLGASHSFQFQSNIIGIKGKMNKNSTLDINYLRYRIYRDLTFNVAISTDQNYNVNTGVIGAKFAIVNKRDKSVYDYALKAEYEWVEAKAEMTKEIGAKFGSKKEDEFLVYFENKGKAGKLSSQFTGIADSVLKKYPDFKKMTFDSFFTYRDREYKKMSDNIDNKPLWTIGFNYTIDPVVNINSEFLWGLVSNKHHGSKLEMDLKADYYDSTEAKERRIVKASAGLNFIFRNAENLSVFELKPTFNYEYIMAGLALNEQQSNATFGGTLRLRIKDDFWLPIDFNYDPKTTKVSGMFHVKLNLNNPGN